MRLPTHRSRRRFSQRTSGLPWTLTVAQAAQRGSDGDSGHSCVPTDDREKLGADRPNPMVTNWRPRPQADTPLPRLTTEKLELQRENCLSQPNCSHTTHAADHMPASAGARGHSRRGKDVSEFKSAIGRTLQCGQQAPRLLPASWRRCSVRAPARASSRTRRRRPDGAGRCAATH